MNQFFLPALARPLPLVRRGVMAAVVTGVAVGCSSPPDDLATQTYEWQLANHLSQSGAVMYGAHWCPHCADQKAMFGDAAAQVPYVECDAGGENPQPELCQAKNLQGYPTWEVEGELYPGVQSLDALANLSGFAAQP